jgi:hypothetical protein
MGLTACQQVCACLQLVGGGFGATPDDPDDP